MLHPDFHIIINLRSFKTVFLADTAVSARQYKGVSAIQSAACLNRVANGGYLLSIGADPNNCDHPGDVPIFERLFYYTYQMLDLLLRCPETKFTVSIMLVRRSCTLRMSLDTRDSYGRTAREALQFRTFTADMGLRMAFDRLQEKASREAKAWHADDDQDEGEEQICGHF